MRNPLASFTRAAPKIAPFSGPRTQLRYNNVRNTLPKAPAATGEETAVAA